MIKGFLILVLCLLTKAYAAYNDTLPKGVRLFAYKQVYVSEVSGYYGDNGSKSFFGTKQKLDAKTLSEIEELNDYYFSILKKYYPELYKDFTAGEWDIKANADVKVSGAGLAYGITKNLTAYAAIPLYDAKVNMNFNRLSGSNYNEINKRMADGANSKTYGLMMDTDSFPEVTGETIQSAVVNYYGYKPLGDWEGKGVGDLELALKYQGPKSTNVGSGVGFGIYLPTGREDDPDILQDVAFGTGHIALYTEMGGSYSPSKYFVFDSYLRFTHSLSTRKELRVLDGENPLVKEKDIFKVFPGEKLEYSFAVGFLPTGWLKLSPEILWSVKGEDRFKGEKSGENQFLGRETDAESISAKMTVEVSSIEAFLTKKFAIPGTLSLSGQKFLSARNVSDYTRFDLDLRIMF